jgi:hypothetical protein
MHALPNSKQAQRSRDEAAVDGLVVSGLTEPKDRDADGEPSSLELRCRRVTDEDVRGALVAAMLGAVNDDRTGQ